MTKKQIVIAKVTVDKNGCCCLWESAADLVRLPNEWYGEESAETLKVLIGDTGEYFRKKYPWESGKVARLTIEVEDHRSNPETWIDPATGLMWDIKGSEENYTFDEIQEYANQLNQQKYGGFDDWRVPERSELATLIDDKVYRPACKISPCKSEAYWSSTTYAPNTTNAWYVYFGYGGVNYNNKTNRLYVRCVRKPKEE